MGWLSWLPWCRHFEADTFAQNFHILQTTQWLSLPLIFRRLGKQGPGVWKPGFHSSIISANLASVWVPKWGNKTRQLCMVFCALVIAQFSMWRPAMVLWEELGHEGLGSGLPPCSTHHQSGNKPCQYSWHRMKCWWWGWRYCGLSNLVKRWGGEAGWFWCYSSRLDELDLSGDCGVPLPCCSSLPRVRCSVIQSNHFYIF